MPSKSKKAAVRRPRGLALYGYRREDLIGKTYPSTMPDDYVRERLNMVRRADRKSVV